MLIGKSLLDYKIFFSPNYYKKNDKVIKKCFLWMGFKNVRMRKICCTKSKKYKEFKNPKTAYIIYKTLLSSGICNKRRSEDEQIFNKE